MNGSWMGKAALRGAAGAAFLVCVLAGQALAAGTIKGKVMVPSTEFDPSSGIVVAASEKLDLYRGEIDADGNYMIENVAAGKYTISAWRAGLTVPDAVGVEVKDGTTVEQNFAMVTPTPFCVNKSATPIPLDKDIDSDAFADAQEIRLDQGKHVGVGPLEDWGKLGGPAFASGRFKVKYSAQAIHLAADLTFKNPLANTRTEPGDVWYGNSLEFNIQNDPYLVTRGGTQADENKGNNWHVLVGLGAQATWYEGVNEVGSPTVSGTAVGPDAYIKRVPTATGEKLRLDMPWEIFKTGGANGTPIKAPADDALGAMDIIINVASVDDPDGRIFQLQWTGFPWSHWNASAHVPVRFCAKAP